MSEVFDVIIGGLDTEVDVTIADSTGIDPSVLLALRGEKGDKGDTGAAGRDGTDGVDGVDGFSPIATVSKVGDTATISITDLNGTTTANISDGTDGVDGTDGADGYSPTATVTKSGDTATITITDINGTTTATVKDGMQANVFVAEFNVTTYADVKDAYDNDAILICTADDSGNTKIFQLAYFDDGNSIFYFAEPTGDGWDIASVSENDGWDNGTIQFASTDVATQLADGLMSALDKQKLDGIASGAEVNVQSDWNQSTNTADDYIKNKPTIPSKTSDLANDSLYARGHIASFHGTCTTGAATAAKAVTCADFKAADLVAGAIIVVSFSETNSAAVTDLTLNVNSTGAHHIKRNSAGTIGNLDAVGNLKASSSYMFYFDGSYWVIAAYYNDTNTNTIGYTIRTNGLQLPVKTQMYRYRICFTSADGEYFVPANASTSTSATASKTVTTEKIDPFGRIVYYNATAAVAVNSYPTASNLCQQYNGIYLGYSFNRTGAALTLTNHKPVYIKCAPQTDGSAIIDADNPFVQALPSTADGKIYIFLGIATAATTIEMVLEHPVYEYKDGCVRQWTNAYVSGGVTDVTVDGVSVVTGGVASVDLTGKQDELESGVNIRTINGTSVLGSGDISVAAGGTPIPTADTVAEFDSDAHINSEDMSSQDVEDFLADINAQGTPSEYRKLLWSNPSPTSAFNAQDVNLDLSDYDAVDIECKHWSNDNTISTTRTEKSELGTISITSNANGHIAVRDWSVYADRVYFGTGKDLFGTSLTNPSNSACVPYKIYGIKYEKVAPPQVEYPNYSTEEQQVGTWVTGKPLYRKVFQYASMPNNTSAVYAHNISNMGVIVRYSCCWWDSTDGRFLMSPRIDSSTVNVRCSINKTNIVLEAIGTNWSTRTSDVNVIVEYTKTTD